MTNGTNHLYHLIVASAAALMIWVVVATLIHLLEATQAIK